MVPLTGPANAPSRLNISEPFNFHHITHTRPHHVQKLETADPNELVSEFSALRASQASQPELRGIKAKDIQREDLSCDALRPGCPSRLRNQPSGWPRVAASRTQDSAPDSPYGAMSPEHSRLTENFSHPSAGYHTAQTSPLSPTSRTSSHHLTPDFFTFHHESPSDTTFESPIPTESPEPLDYSTGTWDDGVYDLASPHAVTTDDSADWNRPVPFTMVKTELAPVEEDDESEEPWTSILASTQRHMTPASVLRGTKSFPNAKTLYCGSDNSMQMSGSTQGFSSPPVPVAEDGPRGLSARPGEDISDSLHGRCILPAKILEPLIEDPLDDIPVRSRFSRCISFGSSDMERFWDMASDAINYSYAHGAEGDSNFDWHRYSIHEDDMTGPVAEEGQTNAADARSKSPNQKPQPDSPAPSRIAARRSSSVYSSSPPPLMPLQTFPSKLDPPSATSTESSFSSIPEAVTPDETTESALTTEFSTGDCKEWCEPAFIVPNDSESQTAQEDLYRQMYTSDYSQEASFQIPNVGRIDGSTISNSPRSSRSPISKSSSQESFWFSQAAFYTRRPRNAGSVGSLPELVSGKNSRERFDPAVDQSADDLTCLNPSDSPSDSQQANAGQRRRSPNLAKDAAQNIMLSKVKTAEEPVPLLPASHNRATSDPTSASQDSSVASPSQPAAARRMRSGSFPSDVSAKGSKGSYNVIPPSQTTAVRSA